MSDQNSNAVVGDDDPTWQVSHPGIKMPEMYYKTKRRLLQLQNDWQRLISARVYTAEERADRLRNLHTIHDAINVAERTCVVLERDAVLSGIERLEERIVEEGGCNGK